MASAQSLSGTQRALLASAIEAESRRLSVPEKAQAKSRTNSSEYDVLRHFIGAVVDMTFCRASVPEKASTATV